MSGASSRRRVGRKGRTVAGLSAVAVTGLLSAYMQALRSPSAYATTNCNVTVGTDNVGSPTPGSLRACINAVESAGGGTITFGVTSVTMVGELPQTTVSLALDGGSDRVTINGGGPTSDFRFLKAALDHQTLALSHVTFQGFKESGDDGSLFYINESYATVTMNDVEFTSNVGDGAGILYWDDGDASVTITGSTFSDNTSDHGVLNFDSDITANISNSSFTGNYATGGAGAFYAYDGDITVSNSVFEDNSTAGYAGAIYVYEPDTLTITDSQFIDNSARYGGAIYVECCTDVTISNSLFDHNTATVDGGAIYQADTLTISNSTFINNVAGRDGAVLADTGTTHITNSYIGSNTGSSILAPQDAITLDFVTVANNTSTVAALLNTPTRVTTLNGSVIVDAVAACVLNGGTTVDSYAVASGAGCGLAAGTSVQNATAGDLDFATADVIEVNGVEQTVLPMDATSILVTGAPTGDLSTGVSADQVGSTRSVNWTIGSRQYGIGPAAPTALSATPGDGEAEIAFTAGAAGSSPITNYQYTLDNGATWQALSPADASSPVTIPGLTNGTSYSIKLRTVTNYGISPWSAPVTVIPAPSGLAPNAPQTPEILAGNGKVTITVHRGAGGGLPTRFRVTAGPGGQTCTITASTSGSCTMTGLTNGTLYTFTAVAINAQGTSGPSSASETAQPGPAKKPTPQAIARFLKKGQAKASEGGTPTPITIEPNAASTGVDIVGDNFAMGLDGLKPNGTPMNLGADGVLVLANERDVKTNGEGFLPATDVNLYVDPDTRESRGTRAARKPASAIYVGSVKVKADGTFIGTATLPDGISAGTHDLQAVGVSRGNLLRVMTLGVYVTDRPGAVRDLSVDSTSSQGTADLSWRWPAGSKVAGIDAYRVDYRPAGLPTFLRYSSVADPYDTVAGLVPGCAYVFRVRAVNGAGIGSAAFTDVTVIADGLRARPAGDVTCLLK